jgi:hypothetical protein
MCILSQLTVIAPNGIESVLRDEKRQVRDTITPKGLKLL